MQSNKSEIDLLIRHNTCT